ncbi:hypothetical protein PIN31115_04446 [Pandoraea iniqua]|uniref:Transposase n=1 Tax=Pandoraea iniqua TaxID=2508288 RepID=A0A5E4YE04_9BURK|nr:hypothetical protein PIN31115_04446 [Pandoraea iniqua]
MRLLPPNLNLSLPSVMCERLKKWRIEIKAGIHAVLEIYKRLSRLLRLCTRGVIELTA